jgi:hypothetical protein
MTTTPDRHILGHSKFIFKKINEFKMTALIVGIHFEQI